MCACAQMKWTLLSFFISQPLQTITLTNPDPLLIKPQLSYWDMNKMVDILQKVVSILFSHITW